MSWSWRNDQYRQIESFIEQKDIELLDVLREPQLLAAIGEQVPKIVGYILAHLKEVVDIAIDRKKTSKLEKKICTNILLIRSPFIRDALNKSSDLFNYLTLSFEKNLDYIPILQLIQSVIEATAGNSLYAINEPVSFFKKLLKLLPSPAVHTFLVELFSRPMKTIQTWAIKIEADVLLVPYLEHAEMELRCALTILFSLVTILPPKSDPMKRMSLQTFIKEIFNIGLDAPTNEVAFSAFQLLVGICNRCDDSEETGEYTHIVDFFESRVHSLCQYIQMNNQFAKDKRAVCELLNTVILAKTSVSEEVYKTASFLFDRFFEMPTNSFLHLVFCSIFQALSKQSGFIEFVEKNRVVEKLLQIEELRNELSASFWGHCTAMELIIRSIVTGNDKWDQFVKEILNKRDEIIASNYGGELPNQKIFASSDSECNGEMQYRCKIIDSCDSVRDLDLKPSDSSSSSSDDSDSHEEDVFISYSGEEEEKVESNKPKEEKENEKNKNEKNENENVKKEEKEEEKEKDDKKDDVKKDDGKNEKEEEKTQKQEET